VDFVVDPSDSQVKIVGVRETYPVVLRGSDQGVNVEYFVWATAEPRSDWKQIAEPSAPHPPQNIEPDKKGRLTVLCSEMHRFRTVKEIVS
jgi:hypothetical protein